MDFTGILTNTSAPSATPQLWLYATVFITITAIEMRHYPGPRGQRWRHRAFNLSLLVAVLPAQILMSALTALASVWVVGHGWGLVALVPHHMAWIGVALLLLGLDLGEYTYHRCMHRFPLLWRFHQVHHCDHALDASTTLREHPGETVVRNSFGILWVVLLGVPLQVLALRQLAMTVSNLCAHSDLTLPPQVERAIGWLLITPNQHRVHHHHKLPYTDSNFGDILSIWDRLLGTRRVLSRDQVCVGLDTQPQVNAQTSLTELLRLPFAPKPLPAAFDPGAFDDAAKLNDAAPETA